MSDSQFQSGVSAREAEEELRREFDQVIKALVEHSRDAAIKSVNDLVTVFANPVAEIERGSRELQSLSEALDKLRRELDNLSQNAGAVVQPVRQAADRIVASTSAFDEPLAEMQASGAKLKELQASLSRLREEVSRATVEVSGTLAPVRQAVERILQIDAVFERPIRQVESGLAGLEKAQKTLEALEPKLQTLNASLEQNLMPLQLLAKRFEAVMSECRQLLSLPKSLEQILEQRLATFQREQKQRESQVSEELGNLRTLVAEQQQKASRELTGAKVDLVKTVGDKVVQVAVIATAILAVWMGLMTIVIVNNR